MLGEIVGHAIVEPRIVHSHLAAVAREVEAKQIAALEDRRSRSDHQITVVLRAQCPAADEADSTRRDLPLPAEGRVLVMGTRKREEPRQRLAREGGYVRRRPPQLLQVLRAEGRFDLPEL